MKTTLTLVLLLCLIPLAAFADDAPSGLFVGGGGPMPTLMFLDLDDLNAAITSAGYPQINQVLFANGGGGYGGKLDGLRIGGYGFGGNTRSDSGSRSVSFDLAYGGMMVEKAVSSDDEFTVVLGTLLGFGSLDLRFISGIPDTFAEAVANPFVSSMSKEFYAVQPYVAFESKPFSWMWVRFQLGFLWTLADQWTFEDAEFAGPPRTLGGLTASLMLRFGGGGQFPLDDMEAAINELSEKLDALDNLDTDSTEPAQDEPVEEATEAGTE
jgi:hypothetical protein